MPFSRARLSALILSALIPGSGFAQEPGFFTDVHISAGMTQGSSDTADGGADFAGGGVVKDVKFQNTAGIGIDAGYQLDPAWSLFLSYQYAHSDVRWNAEFPAIGVASRFSGDALSHTVLANVGYAIPLTSATTLRATAGLGAAFNSFSNVVERDKATSFFLSDVADGTRTSPAARLGIGLRYAVTRNTMVGLDASVTYLGGFRTGETRSGNLGVTRITPYEIDDVWRTGLSASVGARF
ncbi:outer membrane protein [Castellaniella sp.]|uniref:outer membrane protein n=1 Tax=Castellaniella sp. TaxID=1955812 RepID=UPI003C72B130